MIGSMHFLLLLFCMQFIATNPLNISIVRAPFNEFLARFVESEDVTPFKIYYENFITQQKKAKTKALAKKAHYQDTARDVFAVQGWTGLQVRYPTLAAQLNPYYPLQRCSDQIFKKELRRFLVRHGAYEEFLKKKARDQYGTLAKVRRYGRDMGNTIVSWFNAWRSPRNT